MEKMTYAEYLEDRIGDLTSKECLEVIQRVGEGEFKDFKAIELLMPVFGHILDYSSSVLPETHKRLLSELEKACLEFKKAEDADKEFNINEQSGNLFDDLEELLCYLTTGWEIKEFIANARADYRVVIGKKNEEHADEKI